MIDTVLDYKELDNSTKQIMNASDSINLYTKLMAEYDLPNTVVFNFPRGRHGFNEIPLLIIPSINIYIPFEYKNRYVHVELH